MCLHWLLFHSVEILRELDKGKEEDERLGKQKKPQHLCEGAKSFLLFLSLNKKGSLLDHESF